jgi:hypothetical protein
LLEVRRAAPNALACRGRPSHRAPCLHFVWEARVQRDVKVFVLSSGSSSAPHPGPSFTVQASPLSGRLEPAHAELAARGQRVRAVSHTPTGLLAYVEDRP